MSWADKAACKNTSDEIWFPEVGHATAAIKRALAICAHCPVRRECLTEAMRLETMPGEHAHGVRGGLTAVERDAIARGERPMPDFPPPAAPAPLTRPKESTVTVTDLPAPPNQPPTDTDALIAWGTAHQSSRIQALAGKAHRALIDLRQAAERESKVADAEARIERLRAQLANAEQDLRAAKGGKAKAVAAAASSGEDYAAIRSWAREQGMVVATVGRPARAVIDAYHRAHRPAA